MSEEVNLSPEEIGALKALAAQAGRGSGGGRGGRLQETELSAVHGQAERVAAAVREAGDAAKADRDTASALFEAGRVWEFTIMPGRAVAYYERALELDPGFHDAQARLAVNLIRAGRLEEGLRVAVDLAEKAPEFRFKTIKGDLTVTSMTLLGDALRVNGEIEPAIRAYERALELEPDDAHAAARLAELYLIDGRVGKAAALEDKVDPVFNPELKSTLRLTGNDPALLPAVTAIRLNAAVHSAVV